MSNFVLDRIKNQFPPSKCKVIVEKTVPETKAVAKQTNPILPEELKALLMLEEKKTQSNDAGERNFSNIEDFVSWYVPVQSQFTDGQRVALKTLIETNAAINIGCGCKKSQRRNQANDYFKTFWLNNQNTDLPAKVLEVGKFSRVTFSFGNSLLFSFPTLQN